MDGQGQTRGKGTERDGKGRKGTERDGKGRLSKHQSASAGKILTIRPVLGLVCGLSNATVDVLIKINLNQYKTLSASHIPPPCSHRLS